MNARVARCVLRLSLICELKPSVRSFVHSSMGGGAVLKGGEYKPGSNENENCRNTFSNSIAAPFPITFTDVGTKFLRTKTKMKMAAAITMQIRRMAFFDVKLCQEGHRVMIVGHTIIDGFHNKTS